MNGRFTKSLRFRLTCIVAGLFAVALIAAALVTRSYLRSELEQDAREAATALLDDYLAPSAEIVPSVDQDDVTRILYYDATGERVPVYEVQSLLVAQLDQLIPGNEFATLPEGFPPFADAGIGSLAIGSGFVVVDEIDPEAVDSLPQAAIDANPVFFELFADPGPLEDVDVDNAVAVGREVTLGDERVMVVVAAPTTTIDDSVAAMTLVGSAAIPVLTVLVAAITWFVTSRTLRPVEAIRRQVARTDPTRLDRHVPRPGGGDEIDRLAGTMNEMLDRLHGASQQQRRFISDASHELRSPITATIATVEATTASEAAGRWPAIAETITSEQFRLHRLVDDLLILAELDENPASTLTNAGLVDLDEIAIDEANRIRGVSVTAHIESPQRVCGSERLLRRALSNLIDNAARHAAGSVDVTVGARSDGATVVCVDDDGPGIATKDRELVLERFARLDEARHKGEGGAGLGLAIVDEVVRQHNGQLLIGESPTGGARFQMVLPGSQPD